MGGGRTQDFYDLWRGTGDPSYFAWLWTHHGMRSCLLFGGDLLRLGWQINRGHRLASPMGGNQPRFYYRRVSTRTPQEDMGQLTLDNHVLTSLFVMLALAAGLGSQTITIMLESLTALTSQASHH